MKLYFRFAALILIFSCTFQAAIAQKSRAQLEQEKRENQERIERAQRVLNQTRTKKNATLGQLKAINTQISAQSKKIELINEDIGMIDNEVSTLIKTSKELSERLESLMAEYSEMLYLASKTSTKLNHLGFLFSSKSFNDLIMRYKYLEQYTENRKSQMAEIKEVSESLKNRQQELIGKRTQQEKAKNVIASEAQKLSSLKNQQSKTLSQLAKEESTLRAEIDRSKKAIRNLDRLITSVVSRANTRAAANAAEAKSGSSKNEAVTTTSSLVSSFAKNKKRLPWPVQNGFISDRFGVKDHPVLKGVKIDNHGIDIQTSPNARVSSVFGGTVQDVSEIPGLGKVVAIQHGEYFTIYANLQSTNVSSGKNVIAGQLIGIAGQKGGEYEINFQVWHQFSKQNPESWLARK